MSIWKEISLIEQGTERVQTLRQGRNLLRSRLDFAHAKVERMGNLLTICDLHSPTGTRVNGLDIEGEFELEPGDEIVIGERTFVVHLHREPPSTRLLGPKPKSGRVSLAPGALLSILGRSA